MNSPALIFANTELALETLKKLYPEAAKITLVEHGYDNIVGLVDESYAVRFPRNEGAYKRSQYEKMVLNDIKDMQSVATPHVLGEGSTPIYLITSFVHGAHISPGTIRGLTVEQQRTFGQDVAKFAYELHTRLSVDEARKLRDKFGLDKLNEEPWAIYLEKTLTTARLPTRWQEELAKHYFRIWKQYDTNEGAVVLHDDLHTENMLFKNGQLVSVLDFGDTNIGTPEQELRQLYRINETVLLAAIGTYSKLSGRQLNIESAKAWAIVQELAVYARDITAANTNHPAFSRACQNLNTWLPQEKWGEGFLSDSGLLGLQ